MIAAIRWRLARAVLRGGVLGIALTVTSLVAASSLPWARFVAAHGDEARGLAWGSSLTRDGWTLAGLALLALGAGGIVQGLAHEWRLRGLTTARGIGAADEPQASAVLRSLPLVSAGASLASWSVGGTLLGVLSTSVLDLPSGSGLELAVVCITVGAALAPFRYLRVRTELPAFWELLGGPLGATPGVVPRVLISVRSKLWLGFTVPLLAVVLVVAAATAHRKDLAGLMAARWRIDATAQQLARLLDAAVRNVTTEETPKATLELVTGLERRAAPGDEIALLDRDGQVTAGRLTVVGPEVVARALETGEALDRLPGAVVGGARVESTNSWLVVAEPAGGASPWSVLLDPGIGFFVALGALGSSILAWAISRDFRRGLDAVRGQLEALEPTAATTARIQSERLGDDEVAEIEAEVAELAVRLKGSRARREKHRRALEDASRRVDERWRETGQALAGEVALAVRAKRAADGLVEIVTSIEQLWLQLGRELERQDQLGTVAVSLLDDAVVVCDRVLGEVAEGGAQVGHLVALVKPMVEEFQRLRSLVEGAATPMAIAEDLHRTLADQSRTSVEACVRVENLVRSIDRALQGGAESSDRVRVAMGDVGQAVHRIEEGVGLLAQGLKVLEEVADRSALLAVNAAIVAARSAAAGGGFSVVSDEMRDLAQRAADGVHDVTQVVGKLDRDTRSAVLGVETVLTRLDQAAAQSRDSRVVAHELAGATASTQEALVRLDGIAGEEAREVQRARQQLDQLTAIGQRMGISRGPLVAHLEGAGALDTTMRRIAGNLGGGVRTSLAQSREGVRLLERSTEVVERLDALARSLAQEVHTLEAGLRELAEVSVRAQDAARSLMVEVGSAVRERLEVVERRPH